MKWTEMLKLGVFFFFSFPFGYHSGNTVLPRAHLVALLAEVFISQTEGQTLHKKKRKKGTILAKGAIHVAVVKWHGHFYVPVPSHSLQPLSQNSCRWGYLTFFLSFSFFFFFPSCSKYQRIEKCPLLNKCPNVWSPADICVCLLFFL